MKSYKIHSVKYNYIMNMILNVFNLVFPLITFPYVSRVLLPVGIGKVAFASSLVSYFTMVAQLGIPTYGIRACARVRDDKMKLSKTVHELLIINLIMTIIAYICLAIAIFNVSKLYDSRTLIIVSSASIVLTSMGLNWLYSALEQYSYITARSIIMKLLALVLIFLMVRSKNDYIYYALASVVATAGSSLFNILNARRHITFKPFSNYHLKKHIKPIITFFATSVAINIYINLDAVMLGFMTNDSIVGLYSTGVKINSILLQVVTSLGVVMLPRLSYFIINDLVDEFSELTKKAINFVVLISLPLVFYFIFYAKDSILFIAGGSYTDAIVPMQIIMPIILIAGLSNITGIQMLVPMGKEKKLMISVIYGALIDFVLNLFFIPLYGASGAALSTLIAEIVVLIVQVVYLKEYIMEFVCSIKIKTVFAVAIISCSILPIMNKYILLSPFPKLVVTFSCYSIIYALTLLFFREPLVYEVVQMIRNKIKKS
jgi:O-antigen/teichoic acid export membrane protein